MIVIYKYLACVRHYLVYAVFVTKVRTIIVPSMEVQTRNPAVHLIRMIQRRHISMDRKIPLTINHQDAAKSAIILSPNDLSPKALLRAWTAFSSVWRDICPVGLSENTTPVSVLGMGPEVLPGLLLVKEGRQRPGRDILFCKISAHTNGDPRSQSVHA